MGTKLKNICFFVGDLNNSGGTERVASLVANQISNRGENKVFILSMFKGLDPFFDIEERISLFNLYNDNISIKKNFFFILYKLRRFLIEHRIHTLIIVDSILSIFSIPALFMTNIKHICWEHFNFKNNNGIKSRDFSRFLAARYCDFVITLTKKDLEFWKNGLKTIRANLICIPNPSPFEETKNLPKMDYRKVLAVGRLVYVKGYDLLINAWNDVSKKHPDWKLYIVGDGPEEKKLKSLVNQLGLSNSIVFTGRISNVKEHYETSSFFCLSSRNEGLPMVLLEAQSYNLPIVSFDCDTGPSDLIDHMQNGILVENENVKELCQALNNLISMDKNEYERFCEKTHLKSKKFNMNKIVDAWLEVL